MPPKINAKDSVEMITTFEDERTEVRAQHLALETGWHLKSVIVRQTASDVGGTGTGSGFTTGLALLW